MTYGEDDSLSAPRWLHGAEYLAVGGTFGAVLLTAVMWLWSTVVPGGSTAALWISTVASIFFGVGLGAALAVVGWNYLHEKMATPPDAKPKGSMK